MFKRLTVASILSLAALFLISGSALSGEVDKVRISETTNAAGGLAELISPPAGAGDTFPLNAGRVLVSPGYIVGTTHYDYQTNGSTGNRIVKDSFGNIHVCWMNGIDFWSGNRWIYYNFRDVSGSWGWSNTGVQVNPPPQGDGYTNMDVLSTGQGAIIYHSLTDQDWVVLSVDILPGFGSFTEYDVPDNIPGDTVAIWPYVAVDRQDRIHVVAHAYYTEGGSSKKLIYTRSEDQGNTWTTPEVFDTTNSISTIVVASSVDDKVAIMYAQLGQDPDAYNDIIYVESPDGVTWDWTSKRNVTMYDTSCYKDSIWAFADNDAVYDNDGNLHIVWNAFKKISGGGALTQAFLFHWSEATGINFIAKHPEEPSWPPNCEWGGWNWALAKMSIGVDDDDNLFCIYTRFDTTDCSVGGFANGEIYGVASSNGGATWNDPVNLTNSPTPDCWPGECDSDHWSSLAETVDDSLYILYINDKDAGGIPQTEGVDTENPVMYYAVHKEALLARVSIEIIPDDPPVTVPQGGSFGFTGILTNNTGEPQLTDVWTVAIGPQGETYGPFKEFYDVELSPNDSIAAHFYQSVANSAPLGFYTYIAYCGDYGLSVMDSSFFRGEVVPGVSSSGAHAGWLLTGSFEKGEEFIPVSSHFALLGNHPNPFNAKTVISYQLPITTRVKLEVYNLLGEKVATLVDREQAPGSKWATWHASEVSSGLYFYKLTAGDYNETRRMILVK